MDITVGGTYSAIKTEDEYEVGVIQEVLNHSLKDETWEKYKKLPVPFTQFQCSQRSNESIYLLTGLLMPVLQAFADNAIQYRCRRDYIPFKVDKFIISDFLRDHQQLMVEAAITKKRGIIKAATGAGKTFTIAETAWNIWNNGGKVLITVPTRALLYQFQKEFGHYENLSGNLFPKIGLVGDGHYDLDCDITIAIPNSFASKLKKVICTDAQTNHPMVKYLESVTAVLCDECHTAANPTYSMLLHYARNRTYSLGWSATPWQEDGSEMLMIGAFSEQICDINEQYMMDEDVIMSPIIIFKKAPSAFAPKNLLAQEYSNTVYHKLYDFLIVNNQARNALIAGCANWLITQQKGPTIIVVKKIDKAAVSHGQIIRENLLQHGHDLPLLHGGLRKKERERLFEALAEESIPGVVAGPSILKLGVDIPNLYGLVLAAAGSSTADVIQRIGRVLRQGRSRPVVVDFLDELSFFKGQSYKRMKAMIEAYGEENLTIHKDK